MKWRMSELDTARFGVPSLRADDVTREDVPQLLEVCEANNITFAIVRCSTAELTAVQLLEDAGFRLMDTVVSHLYHIDRSGLPDLQPPVLFRPYRPEDYAAVLDITSTAFHGYLGHYHIDPKIDPATADAIYIDWARRETENSTVFVAEQDDRIVGYITFRLNSPEESQIVLGGVVPEAQRLGIYREFLKLGIHWGSQQGVRQVRFVTQITNVAVQRVWARLGCVLAHSDYTLHQWFDR